MTEKQSFAFKKRDYQASLLVGILASLLAIPVILNLKIKVFILLPFFILVPLCLLGIYLGGILGKKFPVIFQFIKFSETGGLNWFTDIGFLNLFILISGLSTGWVYSVFKATSFIFALINSFFWNKFWVFHGSQQKNSTQVLRFLLVSGIGLIINVGVASLIVYLFSAVKFEAKIWANIGAAAGALSAMFWNFLGYKFWVFKK